MHIPAYLVVITSLFFLGCNKSPKTKEVAGQKEKNKAVRAAKQGTPTQPVFQLRIIAQAPSKHQAPAWSKDTVYQLEKEVLINHSHVRGVELKKDAQGTQELAIEFNQKGAARFSKATAENPGRQLAILVDGKVINTPQIKERIDGGRLRIPVGELQKSSPKSDEILKAVLALKKASSK